MTNPAIARIRTALPLVYTLGLRGEVLAFLFFSDPGGPRLRSAAARKSFPKKERAKKKSRQPGESRQFTPSAPITTSFPVPWPQAHRGGAMFNSSHARQ
jgi:hypothetical protein